MNAVIEAPTVVEEVRSGLWNYITVMWPVSMQGVEAEEARYEWAEENLYKSWEDSWDVEEGAQTQYRFEFDPEDYYDG